MLWPRYGWSMRQASALLLVPDNDKYPRVIEIFIHLLFHKITDIHCNDKKCKHFLETSKGSLNLGVYRCHLNTGTFGRNVMPQKISDIITNLAGNNINRKV